jgi:hypothetical protein
MVSGLGLQAAVALLERVWVGRWHGRGG